MEKNLRKEVRDEKIVWIIKEFREKFLIPLDLINAEGYDSPAKEMESWLTQTLTTFPHYPFKESRPEKKKQK